MSFTRLQRTESEIRSGQGNNREKDNDRKREETVDHERLEINKRIIQEKQGKDKPARGADLSVRTV